MAQVQENAGIPTVAPAAGAPDSYQRINASPEAFGAGIGTAVQQVGKSLGDVGKVWGEIVTDSSLNSANDEATAVVEKFKALRGQDALNAQKQTSAALTKIYADKRAKLKGPEQQERFDQQSRAFHQRFLAPQVFNHATAQSFEYAKEVNSNGVKQWMDILAANAEDPARAEDATQEILGYAGKLAHMQLGDEADDEAVDGYMRPYQQAAYKTRAQAIGVKNPKAAADFVDEHKDVIGVDYASLSTAFRTRAYEQEGLGVADQSFAMTAQKLENPPARPTASLKQALLEQESGDKGPNPYQVQQATWDQWKNEGLVHPGEEYGDPNAIRTVGDRAVDKYSAQYEDPARVAVAWFSGPGNVAPAGSATPFLVDKSDRNGKTVSSYVEDVTNRLGSQGPQLAAKANFYDNVLKLTEGKPPQVRQVALREGQQRFQAAQIADLSDAASRKAQSDATFRGYGDLIRSGQGATLPWRQDQSLTNEQVEHLDKVAIEHANASLKGPPGDFGPKYSEVQSRILSTGENRIVNQEQLVAMAARREINPAGLKAASDLLKEMNEPGAESERRLRDNFWTVAQKQIENKVADSSIVRPERRKKWNEAMPVLTKAFQDGRAAGLTTAQLTDPNNKDSIWNAVEPFLPTHKDVVRAQMLDDSAKAAAAKGKTEPAPFDWQAIDNEDVALKAWDAHQITEQQARELWNRHGWGKPSQGAEPEVPAGGVKPEGLLEEGNIDLHERPVVKNPDGSYSTVNTYGFSLDGGRVINVPGVDGTRQLTSDEALEQYKKTGKHLGIFKDKDSANKAAKQLHLDQEREYAPKAGQ